MKSAWYQANKDRLRRKRNVNYAKRKVQAIAYKGGKCFDCNGVFPPAVYDFHHLEPSKKDFNPAALRQCSWERFRAEIDKCVMLCANCHRTRHWIQDAVT